MDRFTDVHARFSILPPGSRIFIWHFCPVRVLSFLTWCIWNICMSGLIIYISLAVENTLLTFLRFLNLAPYKIASSISSHRRISFSSYQICDDWESKADGVLRTTSPELKPTLRTGGVPHTASLSWLQYRVLRTHLRWNFWASSDVNYFLVVVLVS